MAGLALPAQLAQQLAALEVYLAASQEQPPVAAPDATLAAFANMELVGYQEQAAPFGASSCAGLVPSLV
ncbi:MAG: hypothetical protein DMF62_03685 [Acidobacteria bacterium]|nr:MAG: hypothetical protein DMF62_03685 [Acidobacteriota bacterium]